MKYEQNVPKILRSIKILFLESGPFRAKPRLMKLYFKKSGVLATLRYAILEQIIKSEIKNQFKKLFQYYINNLCVFFLLNFSFQTIRFFLLNFHHLCLAYSFFKGNGVNYIFELKL
jgi:hypothetical protein